MVAAMLDERLTRFYDYWLERKTDRRSPAGGDIDPLDFPYMLGHIMMFDVLQHPPHFRVRLHGTESTYRAHYDLTGKVLDEMPDTEQRGVVMARCEGLVMTGVPLAIRRARILDGESRPYEALWLPFSEDGSRVTLLLCAMIYDPNRAIGSYGRKYA